MQHTPNRITIPTSVPPTPGEIAATSVSWERRGLLGRLVRPVSPGARRESR